MVKDKRSTNSAIFILLFLCCIVKMVGIRVFGPEKKSSKRYAGLGKAKTLHYREP